MSIGDWFIWVALGVLLLTLAIIGSAFIEYFHHRSIRKAQARYELELAYQNARAEELSREKHQAILEEVHREYMDAMRGEDIIKELENGEGRK